LKTSSTPPRDGPRLDPPAPAAAAGWHRLGPAGRRVACRRLTHRAGAPAPAQAAAKSKNRQPPSRRESKLLHYRPQGLVAERLGYPGSTSLAAGSCDARRFGHSGVGLRAVGGAAGASGTAGAGRGGGLYNPVGAVVFVDAKTQIQGNRATAGDNA